MNFKSLMTLSEKELGDKEKEIRLELMKENAQVSAGTALKNPGLMREYKRTLARIKTLRNKQ